MANQDSSSHISAELPAKASREMLGIMDSLIHACEELSNLGRQDEANECRLRAEECEYFAFQMFCHERGLDDGSLISATRSLLRDKDKVSAAAEYVLRSGDSSHPCAVLYISDELFGGSVFSVLDYGPNQCLAAVRILSLGDKWAAECGDGECLSENSCDEI